MVKPVNAKLTIFSIDQLAICPFFVQIQSKIANSVFLFKILNIAILSIFRPKQFCSVPNHLLKCILRRTCSNNRQSLLAMARETERNKTVKKVN